ncbi:MAG: HD domain-containing protein [Eubacteriales bacterium]|nr:HD domain-containing protein [Eubacteriales bacterium]
MTLLTQKEKQDIYGYLQAYMDTPEAQSMKNFCQHGAVSTYDHVMNVAKLSYFFNKRLHLGADEKSLLVGAFLHDFYLYDWHEKDASHRWHGFYHADKALFNASRVFLLSKKEQDIIRQHMWPLTLRQVPSCRESLIVCLSDKISSTLETFFRRS